MTAERSAGRSPRTCPEQAAPVSHLAVVKLAPRLGEL